MLPQVRSSYLIVRSSFGSWQLLVRSCMAGGSSQLVVRSWQLAVGSSQFAVGSSQLVVGSWQLAVGSC